MQEQDRLENLTRIFQLQKANSFPIKTPSYSERIDRLNRLEKLIKENSDIIVETIGQDFGTRSKDWGFVADLFSPLTLIRTYKKNLKNWMKTERKPSGILAFTGQRTFQINEPLGVVGIMSPFNAPVSLALDPAIEAIGAGNSVMIKMSEHVSRTASLMKELVKEYFDESELAVITGGVDISKAFAKLPWDKFFFTGGSEVGKKILASLAENLTPAILELGGKNPCILLEDADVEYAAKRIVTVRLLNAGQVCLAGDYVFVPKKQLDKFVAHAIQIATELYPNIISNPHYTSIINDEAYNRIVEWIQEAKNADCKVIEVNPSNEPVPDPISRKIPLTLVVNPPKHLNVATKEIFGPVLTIFDYSELDDVIKHINSLEKPLAIYSFGKNNKMINKILENTSSGGVTINDLLMHANSKYMGFGGVGYSGMGRYKGGKIGFYAFTNPKAIHKQGFLLRKMSTMFFPPYKSDILRKMLRRQVGMKD